MHKGPFSYTNLSVLEQHLCSQAADRHDTLQARMLPDSLEDILNIAALGWALSEARALSTSLLLRQRGNRNVTCPQSFKLYRAHYRIIFLDFVLSPFSFPDVSGLLKAFFISRCQPAYPFTDSRPDCSCERANSRLTVLLPLFFSSSVQKAAQAGWHWRASSRWPVVTGDPTGDRPEG